MSSVYPRTVLLLLALQIASVAIAQTTTDSKSSILPLPEARPAPTGEARQPTFGEMNTPAVPGYPTSVATGQPGVYSMSSSTPPRVAMAPNPPAIDPASVWNTPTSTQPANSTPGVPGCGECMGCLPCCSSTWFGSVGGLVMTRNAPNPFWTTYQTNNNPNQVMNTKEAGGNWTGGGQVTVGRWWCCNDPCGCNNSGFGLQFTYWQLADLDNFASVNSLQLFGVDSQLSTPIDLGGVTITNGAGTNPASAFFDNASEQRIWRTDRFLNFEINVLKQQLYAVPNQCSLTCLAGVRYFRFQDIVTYGSVAGGFVFGEDGGQHEAYLQSKVTNNMVGGQIGMLANYSLTPRWGTFALPKVGVFGNQIYVTNQLYTGDGFTTFNIHAHKAVVSMMAELDLGTYYWISQHCQLFAGWRVLGLSHVGLADNQFLPFLADSAGFAAAKANGDLILTGAFGGVAFTF